MSLKLSVKRHDTKPSVRLKVTTTDSEGETVAFDLTGATSAKFLMRPEPTEADPTPALKVDAAAVLETPLTTGYVRYDWADGDLDTLGTFQGEFEVFYTGPTDKLTLPSGDKYVEVVVNEDVNNE